MQQKLELLEQLNSGAKKTARTKREMKKGVQNGLKALPSARKVGARQQKQISSTTTNATAQQLLQQQAQQANKANRDVRGI